MRVLTLNCGSSSLKFDVFAADGDDAVKRVASGAIEGIGHVPRAWMALESSRTEMAVAATDHSQALDAAIGLLGKHSLDQGLDAIGHRVVHGGIRLWQSTRITAKVLEALRETIALAPLHNQPTLDVIEAAALHLPPDLPAVAVFDTAFYKDLAESAWRYALPRELSDRYSIRRFGFHGLAHSYMVSRLSTLQPENKHSRIVSLQLGGGCSATATIAGRPIATSMGYTPLEGLIMSTRSGDLDPALPLGLQALTGMDADEVELVLNQQSGLLGLSGVSGDIREVQEAAAAGNHTAALAVEAFCDSIVQYVGGYMALMGGCDRIVFGGGIGENNPEVRQRVCHQFAWAGLEFDEAANATVGTRDTRISAVGSKIEAWVLHVDEATEIAREVARALTA